jgi:tetratricopeptide (TPR) repeat protein
MVRLTVWFRLFAAVLSGVIVLAQAKGASDDSGLKARILALNEVTGKKPIEGQVKLLVSDPSGTKKLLAEALPLAKEKNPPFNINGSYILAAAAFELKDYEASGTFYQICLNHCLNVGAREELNDVYNSLIKVDDRLYRDRKFEQCDAMLQQQMEWCQEHGIGGEVMAELVRRRSRVREEMGKPDEADKLAQTLLKADQENWQNLELEAWLLRKRGKSEQAVHTYEKMLEVIAKDKNVSKEDRAELTSEIRYLLSNVYMDLDQVTKAGEQLELLLKQSPDDPSYNNDLGYIWADHDMNLDKAEAMIRKAIEQDRKQREKNRAEGKADGENDKMNAAYLDSLGWVLFKQKKYQEAKPYLLQAIEDKEGQHVEIFDHLGQVYMALGDKAAAIAAWKKGIEAAGSSKREQERKAELEKRVKNKE